MKHADLIARLETAEVGSYTLDAEIWDIEDSRPRHDLGEEYPIYKRCLDDSIAFDSPPSYTTSLDAALALAERLSLDACELLFNVLNEGEFRVNRLALALCIAILRALDSQSITA